MNLKRTTSFRCVPESEARGQETFKTDKENKKVTFIQSRPFYIPTFGCYHAIMIYNTDFSKKKKIHIKLEDQRHSFAPLHFKSGDMCLSSSDYVPAMY